MKNEHSHQRYLDLAEKWVNGTITDAEMQEYADWLKQADPAETLEVPASLASNKQHHKEKIYNEIRRRINRSEAAQKKHNSFVAIRWAAACIALLLLGYSVYYFTGFNVAKKENITKAAVVDIVPGTNGAVLQLANGKVIVLDTATNGALDQAVLKNSEAVVFESAAPGAPVEYHTLITPRARQQQLVLPDGSHIWLNAESSIRFPTAFTGNKREVEITGEAYFEISHNKAKPFVVKVHQSRIQVLGTRFNVMAYPAESYLETTLLQGSVAFHNQNQQLILKPGQQSRLSGTQQLQLIPRPDIDGVMAWKNGLQSFNQKNIGAILRQIQRWYDVEVAYAGNIPSNISFSGDIPREVTLSQLLKALESRQVHFTLDAPNRKLHVAFNPSANKQ